MKVLEVSAFMALSDEKKLEMVYWLDKTDHHPWYSIREDEVKGILQHIAEITA